MTGPHRLSLLRGLAAGAGAGVIVLVGLLLVSAFLQTRSRQSLDATADLVERNLQESVDNVFRQLSAHAALFLASDEVDPSEFERFVASIEHSERVRGWGVVEVVPAVGLAAWVEGERLADPSFRVFPEAPPIDGLHLPVRFWHSEHPDTPDPRGLDVAATPQAPAVLRAIASRRPDASPLTPFTLFEGTGSLLAYPVVDGDEPVTLVVTSPVVLSELVTAILPSTLANEVEVTLGGAAPRGDDAAMRTVTVGSERWTVTVTPAPGSSLTAPGANLPWAPAAAIAVALLTGTAGYALSRRSELQRELAETVRLNRARDQFLGVVSHEIRTPLTAVVGFADELYASWEQLPDEQRSEMLRIIHEQGQEVAGIVADLLVIGRADIGSLYLHRTPVPVLDVVSPALHSLSTEDRARVEVEADGGTVLADRSRASQIVRNLLVNAVRHGGGRIVVRTGTSRGEAWIQVRDEGEGIPLGFREAIFDPYVHVPDSGRPLPSTGLGLFVARRLAEAMGGSLVHRREGDWTVFELTLPAAAPARV